MSIALPAGLHFFERGWLSSNAVFLDDGHSSVLIDTGYHTHSSLLLDFLHLHLNDRSLSFLVNTHLHSDHCGGNKAVQTKYPQVETLIPYGLFSAVLAWDSSHLSFDATGQACPSLSQTMHCVQVMFAIGRVLFGRFMLLPGMTMMLCFFLILSIVF